MPLKKGVGRLVQRGAADGATIRPNVVQIHARLHYNSASFRVVCTPSLIKTKAYAALKSGMVCALRTGLLKRETPRLRRDKNVAATDI